MRTPRRVADHLRLVTEPAKDARPAQNHDAEVAVWASAIDDRACLTQALSMGLKAEHFHDEANARVWAALTDMANAPDAAIHTVIVAQWLRDRQWPEPEHGWTAYLARRAHLVGPLPQLVKLLIELASVRAIGAEAQEIANEAGGAIDDREAWIARASERVRARVSTTSRGAEEPDAILPRLLAEVAEGGQGIMGYPSGIAGIDKWLGGLVPAELLLLTGVEKSGKSSLGAQICATVSRGRATAAMIIQWEDPSDKTLMRLVGARARVDLSRLRTGAWDRYDTSAFARASNDFAGRPLKIEDECRPDVASIAARIRAAQDDLAARGLVLAVVMIDSLQVLEGEGQNREQQIENAMKGINALKRAKDLQRVSWIVVNHTGADGEMVNARAAPRRWCNTWLHLDVEGKDKEAAVADYRERARPAHLKVKLHRDLEAGRDLPLWCIRSLNNLFLDGGE
ncbi:MAG: DnaB-like helicase C-terminal domain-containing protein [Alphaproteobacteria bacterium]